MNPPVGPSLPQVVTLHGHLTKHRCNNFCVDLHSYLVYVLIYYIILYIVFHYILYIWCFLSNL